MGIKAVLMVAVLFGLISLLVMSLWNVLIPDIFQGPRIGFWQAAGLLVLSRLLFGMPWRGGPGRWHQRRWERMTPEERQRLQARVEGICGARTTPPAPPPPAS